MIGNKQASTAENTQGKPYIEEEESLIHEDTGKNLLEE